MHYTDILNLLFFYLVICEYFHLPYRQTEGVITAHAGKKAPSIPDYSTINRRVNKLDIRINERIGNNIVIVLDSTGIKVTNRGEWLPHKWNVRKKRLSQNSSGCRYQEKENCCTRCHK